MPAGLQKDLPQLDAQPCRPLAGRDGVSTRRAPTVPVQQGQAAPVRRDGLVVGECRGGMVARQLQVMDRPLVLAGHGVVVTEHAGDSLPVGLPRLLPGPRRR